MTTLIKAIEKAINIYNKMALPTLWGSGDNASGDGTHHTMYDKNILSEFHFRYRKKGAIGYYIVSDKYIALFSSLIPCGVHESLYILDNVMQDDLDIKPSTYHGDTHAQSYAVFGLAYLMGIDLMPRIRGVNRLKFYKPDGRKRYKNISKLFDDKIDWKLIEHQLPKMLRIVLSIQQGTITPSSILKQMSAYNTQNNVALAFRELGRAVRTLFLLRYISDYELRCFIHQQTNKSEQFNAFAKWIFFANDGKIRENLTVNQEKIIKYNHLTANLLVLYNTHQLTKALNEMKTEGMKIEEEWAKHLSPYKHGNLNRLGEYSINPNQKIEDLMVDFDFID